MDKFEYKTMVTNFSEKVITGTSFQNELNKLGDDGWEMAGMTCNTSLGSSKYSLVGLTSSTIFVFKRKKL